MKDRIEILLTKIGKLMQEQLANKEYGLATNLSPLLERVHLLQKHYTNFEHELVDLESATKRLKAGANGHDDPYRVAPVARNGTGRAGPKTLRITIDWKANGRKKEKEEISLSKATDCMAEFVRRLIDEFGDRALQALAQLRVNRGPLLSRFPKRDFGAYQHKRVGDTEYFVLTHSSTDEKADNLKEICRALSLVPGSVEIQTVGRFSLLDGF